MICLALLIAEESLLVATFKLRYFKRFDVWVKWAVYAGTIVGFVFQSNLEVGDMTCYFRIGLREHVFLIFCYPGTVLEKCVLSDPSNLKITCDRFSSTSRPCPCLSPGSN